ncbi:methyl-accepting chemotaxis sensory transducer with Cache sensor [Formivibrio citricus]|uniref:Methyl-accepting chemotaxis sensory transducer with Cache sensor n=1 Tax=Formivibrio citricus TaxID=83765 RepID=A0A1I5DJ58_9NEIS|nr:methyl-accepting chemotaxis protein [Formivibrio citricus]SFN99157.1 methyl-accepting chemotaxis sensory transducer with Cache sensor [Formivibrio citricus]
MNKLDVKTRLAIALGVAFLGIVLLSVFTLFESRASGLVGHQERIKHLVEVANGIVGNYQKLEAEGKLTRAEAQQQAREALRSPRFSKDDYFFIYDFEGRAVMVAGNPKIEGQIMLGKADTRGYKLWDAFVSTAKGPGAGYVEYWFPRAGATESSPKLAYVAAVPGWNWIVGTGVYIDDVSVAMKRKAIQYGLVTLVIIALAGVIGILAARSIVLQLGGEPTMLMAIMRRAANGNLATDFPVNGNQDSVLANLKSMLEGLGKLVRDVGQASSALGTSADMVSDAASQVSEMARSQSDSTSAMAAGVEEMTVAINHIADSANETEAESRRAAKLAEEGGEHMNSAVAMMQSIERTAQMASERVGGLAQRAQQVGSVTAVIKEIADQTNLLALNAAIEAARAGETGRGFAVVADEVRKLAERTASATVEINQMIMTMQQETHSAVEVLGESVPQARQGVALTESTAAVLSEIRAGVLSTLDRIREVASSTREQSLASTSISQQVERIAQAVDETSATMAASAEEARRLEALAQTLQGNVSRFQV